MNEDKKIPQVSNNVIAHFGTFDFAGKGPGSYSSGAVKLRANTKEDLINSANSFLKAADRCLNGSKIEEGVEMLTVPGTVCASLSCELFLKYILLAETGKLFQFHELVDLFNNCSEEIQSDLIERNASILTIIERNNVQFVKARYHHEKDIFSFCQPELLQTAELLSKYVSERYTNKST
jgi:HEPN domain-containing protein